MMARQTCSCTTGMDHEHPPFAGQTWTLGLLMQNRMLSFVWGWVHAWYGLCHAGEHSHLSSSLSSGHLQTQAQEQVLGASCCLPKAAGPGETLSSGWCRFKANCT